MEAFAYDDLPTARAEQRQSVAHVEVLLEHGVLRTGKAMMSLIGVDCGPIRPPFKPIDAAELAVIARKSRDHAEIFSRPLRAVP